jgi:glycosyltransferase involved in cell wall biosynthesis
MKILILTQYFPPETGAPQNRLFSLASNLKALGAEVSVLTAMPNYPKMELYEGYKGKWYSREQIEGIDVHRSWIYVRKSKSIIPRLLNYFSFVFSSLLVGLFKVPKHDVIICESPPLFLGISALILKWAKRSRLVFNVSDLWPESAEKLGIVTNKQMLGISYWLEKILYKRSDLVSGQTDGIIQSINQRYPDVPTHLLRNGIDMKQFSNPGNRDAFRNKHGIAPGTFVFTYAGIIGHAQGLEIIIKAASRLRSYTDIVFLIIGDGPEKPHLTELSETMQTTNVRFIPSVSRTEMVDVVAACDAYIAPLKKNDLFLGAIPSKIFEPLSHRKPVILGVNGEAYELFVKTGQCALHFEPENEDQLTERILELYNDRELLQKLGENGLHYVSTYFDREKLAQAFWNRIQEFG